MDKRTIEAYEVYHEVYDAETRDFWEKFPADILNSFVEGLKGNRVLDLGSGPGRDAVLLRNKGLDVLCLDGSQNMVDATNRLGFQSIKRDFRHLELQEETLDGVWAYSSLIHVSFAEAKEIISQIFQVLKPGGLLFLGLIEGSGNEERKIGNSRYTRYFEYYDDKKLKDLFTNSGFNLLQQNKFKPGNHIYRNILLSRNPQ